MSNWLWNQSITSILATVIKVHVLPTIRYHFSHDKLPINNKKNYPTQI